MSAGRAVTISLFADHPDMQLLSDAERYIATLRESSCNYVDLLRKERELYHQVARQYGAPEPQTRPHNGRTRAGAARRRAAV